MADEVEIRITGRDSSGPAFASARRSASGLSGVVDSLGDAMLGAVGNGLRIASVIPAAAGLSAALVTAAGAAILLPAALGAAAFGVAALSVATEGFATSLDASNPKKQAAAIAALSPAANQARIAVEGLRGGFDRMKDSVQDGFFADLAPRISALGTTYVPLLGAAFLRVASAANLAARETMDMLTSSERVGDVEQVLGSFAAVWENVAATVAPLGAVIVDVLAVASDVLIDLTGGLGTAAAGFAAFIAAARESGELEGWIRAGVAAIGDMVAVGGNLIEIISGIFGATGVDGPGFLATIRSATQAIADLINSAAGQATLQALFGVLSQVASVLITTLPIWGPVAAGVLALAMAMRIYAIGAAAAAVVMNAVPLALALARAAVVAYTAVQWALNVALAANPIGIVVVAIGLLIAALVWAWQNSETFRDVLTACWDQAVWVITSAVDQARAVIDWFAELPRLFGEWWSASYDAVVDQASRMIDYIAGIPGWVIDRLGGLGSMLWDAGSALIGGFWDGITARWDRLVAWFRGAMARLRGLFPFSPAKEGPFSGSGYVDRSGTALTEDFAAAVAAGQGRVRAAVAGVVGAASGGFDGPSPAGGAVSAASVGGGRAVASGTAVSFGGDLDSAFATAFMSLVRSGRVQLSPVG